MVVNEDIKEIAKNEENIWTKPQLLQQMIQQELVLVWLQAWESELLINIYITVIDIKKANPDQQPGTISSSEVPIKTFSTSLGFRTTIGVGSYKLNV